MTTKESIIHELKVKGLKITPQRLAIIDVLIEQKEAHPGASLIFREARKRAKDISLSTVYATLNELANHGVIKMLQFDRAENRYEGNLAEHVNLVCNKCRKIVDYMFPVSIDPKEIAEKTGFDITDTRLEYYGYCEECSKENPRRLQH